MHIVITCFTPLSPAFIQYSLHANRLSQSNSRARVCVCVCVCVSAGGGGGGGRRHSLFVWLLTYLLACWAHCALPSKYKVAYTCGVGGGGGGGGGQKNNNL